MIILYTNNIATVCLCVRARVRKNVDLNECGYDYVCRSEDSLWSWLSPPTSFRQGPCSVLGGLTGL